MAALSFTTKKSGSDQSTWEFYIQNNTKWLREPLKTEKNGDLVGPDGKSVAFTFAKGSTVQIMDLKPQNIEGRKLVKVKINGVLGWTQVTNIMKPTSLNVRDESGNRVQETQEHNTINAINEAVSANSGQPITIKTDDGILTDIVRAEKNEGRNQYGYEKYVDVWLIDRRQQKIGLSMKMKTAPSLFGGGYQPLFDTDPKFMKRILNKALNAAIHDKRFELGSKKETPAIFIKFTNKKFIHDAMTGTSKMGGPVSYMFQGAAKPEYSFKDGVLTFTNETILTVDEYAKAHGGVFYLRIRRRDSSYEFTNEVDSKGFPLFWAKQGSKQRGRIVVYPKPDSTGLVVDDR